MSDANTSLPIRTEANGDVAARIVDGTITSQALTVNSDGSINITDNSGSITVDGTVELGATTLAALESVTVQNGSGGAAVNIQDGGNSITVDGTVELGATTLAALESITVSATDLDIRDLTFATDKVDVSGSSVEVTQGTSPWVVSATDLDIRDLAAATDSVSANLKDGAGTSITSTTVGAKQALDVSLKDVSGNPLGTSLYPIVITQSVNGDGTEINTFNSASAIAAAATSNHDYTVTAGKTLFLTQIEASASGKAKIEIQVETAAASGTFTTKFVQFNSTAETNMSIKLASPLAVVAGAKVRIIRTNRENQPQDLYSTICGSEV